MTKNMGQNNIERAGKVDKKNPSSGSRVFEVITNEKLQGQYCIVGASFLLIGELQRVEVVLYGRYQASLHQFF
jgi:hypothetical protein